MKTLLDDTYEDLGYDPFLNRSIQSSDPNYQTGEEFNLMTEDSVINSSKIKGDLLIKKMVVNDGTQDVVILGKLTADTYGITVVGGTITGATVTGGTFQTATSGARVVIDNDAGFQHFGTGGLRLAVDAGGLYFYDTVGNSTGAFIGGTTRVTFSGSDLYFGGVSGIDLIPVTDNTGRLGTETNRWNLIRGTTITPGDLGFEEKTCYKCHKKWKIGDELKLIVKSINKDGEPLTVPIHSDC